MSAQTEPRDAVEVVEDATCVVVEDHAVVRAGVVLQLQREPWLRFVGQAATLAGGARLILAKKPGLALVDLRLGDGTGIELTEQLRAAGSPTRVVLYSAFTDSVLVRRAFAAGAWGFVDKASDPVVMLEALREARRGRRYVDPVLAPSVVSEGRPELSRRELEVLRLMADGHSNQQAADKLGLNVETVKTHVKRVLAKLEAESRTEAVAQALRRSLIV